MPAIITHNCFGEDAMASFPDVCGNSRAECDAFLLGNQGPDPLFFVPGPAPRGLRRLARAMHKQRPAHLLLSLRRALDSLDEDEQGIGYAYAHGFLCHYLLDSSAHPLVHSMMNAICDAEIEGLSHEDDKYLHSYIEREWDEMALTVKCNTTVASYHPAEILNVDDRVIAIAQKLYAFMALSTYNTMIDTGAFQRAINMYYLEQRAIHSRTGVKRLLFSLTEELVKPYSYVRSVAPRPVPVESTWLANPDCNGWENPHTGEVCSLSFWDIYDEALARVEDTMALFDSAHFDEQGAHELTGDINFSGQPTVATLTVHEED